MAWATTASLDEYERHRDEFDRLVIAVAPGYEAAVNRRLDEFETRVTAARERYDANHSGPQFVRPWRVRWAQRALFWLFFLGITGSCAFMFPNGGRVHASVSSHDWPLNVMISSILFVVGVIALLLRRLPVRPGIPPRRELAWFPVALGVPTIANMFLLLSSVPGVQTGWIVLAIVALAVSIAYAITRIVERRRNPELTRQVDASESKRLRIWADNLKIQADQCADRIERDFAALPESERSRMLAELSAATAVLRQRGLIGTWSDQDRKSLGRLAIRGQRPMIPGFLLLERRVQEVWRPRGSELGMTLRVTWHVPEYLPLQK